MVSPYTHLSRDELLRLLNSRERRDSSARVAKAFAKEAEQYRNVVEQAADGIFILDQQGRFLEVNESGARMLGRTRQGLVGRRVRELVMPEDLPKHLADWKALRQGKAFIAERRLKRKDGSGFPVEVSAKRLSDGRFEGILRDITGRKEAENTLRESEQRFRNLTAAAFEGIGISERGKVVDVNDQLARMLGYRREELIGREVSVMVAPESRLLVGKAIQTGHEGTYEHLALRKDGTSFEAEVRAKTVMWGGRPVRVSAIRDITERKRAAEALQRQLAFNQILNRILSTFATCAMP